MMNQQEADLIIAMGNLLRMLGNPNKKKLDTDQKKRFNQMLNITAFEIDRTVDHLEIMCSAGEENGS